MTAKRLLITVVLLGIVSGAAKANEKYALVGVWPEAPKGWHFHYIWDVAVDNSGNVYILDYGALCVKKFDSEGRFINRWGRPGKGDGEFSSNSLRGLDVDNSGIVYVLEGNRVQKFTSHGSFLETWEVYKSGDKERLRPYDIAVDSKGNVFILLTQSTGAGVLKF